MSEVAAKTAVERTSLIGRFWALLKDSTAIFASLVAAFTALGWINSKLPERWQKNNVVSNIQINVANAIAPKGYAVVAGALPYLDVNDTFTLQVDGGVLLKGRASDTPVGLRRDCCGWYSVAVDGHYNPTIVGAKIATSNKGCYIWLYKVEVALKKDDTRFDYNYRCDSLV